MDFGRRLAEARKNRQLTQEKLAEKLGVSFQAVSSWERGESLPDTARLPELAAELDVSLDALMDDIARPWTLCNPNFDPEHMYTYLKTRAAAAGLTQTLAALPLMRSAHGRQIRRSMVEDLPYAVHPLTMACHALAMGIGEDDVLAALLLHDVVEDTETSPDELPVGERVREAVCLVSYNSYSADPADKEKIKPDYYGRIARCPLAALVKCIDRCHNLSGMADGMTRPRMCRYVTETEKYVLPLLDAFRAEPAWNDAAWLLRYQIISLLEAFKRLL